MGWVFQYSIFGGSNLGDCARLLTENEVGSNPTRRANNITPLRLVARITAFQAVETGSKPVGVTNNGRVGFWGNHLSV